MHHPGLIDRVARGAATLQEAVAGAQRRIEANSELGRDLATEPAIGMLLSGWACRYRLLPDGRRQILDVLLPGDLVGLDQLFTAQSRDFVLTLTEVTLGSVERETLLRLCLDPDVMVCLLSRMAAEKQRLDHKLTMLGQMVADERIAALLVESYERLARQKSIKGESFHFPLTQQQIGDLLGMTVVHVNRVLKRLRNEGIVVVKHRVAIIRDMAKLLALASGGLVTDDPDPGGLTMPTAMPPLADDARALFDETVPVSAT